MKTDFNLDIRSVSAPTVFNADFNNFAPITANQAWSLFFTAGQDDAVLGDSPVLGHIATSAKVFVQFIASDAPPFGDNVDIHDLNEQQRKRQQRRSWPEVQAYWQQVRDDVTAFLVAGTSDLGGQPARLPWMPNVQTAGDALRLLILHTKSHREELVRGTAVAVEE